VLLPRSNYSPINEDVRVDISVVPKTNFVCPICGDKRETSLNALKTWRVGPNWMDAPNKSIICASF
jgi:hypothetical protein